MFCSKCATFCRRDSARGDRHWSDERSGRRGRGRRRIANDKDFRMTLELKELIHDGAADAIVRSRKRLHQRIGAHAGGPNDRRRGNNLCAVNLDALLAAARHARICLHFDAADVEPLQRMSPECRSDAAQNLRRGFEQEQAQHLRSTTMPR